MKPRRRTIQSRSTCNTPGASATSFAGVVDQFNRGFGWLQERYDYWLRYSLRRPVFTVVATVIFVALSFALFPWVGPRIFSAH